MCEYFVRVSSLLTDSYRVTKLVPLSGVFKLEAPLYVDSGVLMGLV